LGAVNFCAPVIIIVRQKKHLVLQNFPLIAIYVTFLNLALMGSQLTGGHGFKLSTSFKLENYGKAK